MKVVMNGGGGQNEGKHESEGVRGGDVHDGEHGDLRESRNVDEGRDDQRGGLYLTHSEHVTHADHEDADDVHDGGYVRVFYDAQYVEFLE